MHRPNFQYLKNQIYLPGHEGEKSRGMLECGPAGCA